MLEVEGGSLVAGQLEHSGVGSSKIVVPVAGWELAVIKDVGLGGGEAEDTNLRETLPTADYIVHPRYTDAMAAEKTAKCGGCLSFNYYSRQILVGADVDFVIKSQMMACNIVLGSSSKSLHLDHD